MTGILLTLLTTVGTLGLALVALKTSLTRRVPVRVRVTEPERPAAE